MKTYTYKIKSVDSNFEQKFTQWIGTCRFVYNAAKELKETVYRRSGTYLHRFDIQKQLTQAKKDIDFLNNVSSSTLVAITERLDRAYEHFFNGGGYPKWAAKHRWRTIPFKSVKYLEGDTFQLPKWGKLRVFFSRDFSGSLRVARIKKEVDGYYLQVVTDMDPNINSGNNQVGIDLGIKYYLVTSDGKFFKNPQLLKKYEDKLRVEKRSLSRKSTDQITGINNYNV